MLRPSGRRVGFFIYQSVFGDIMKTIFTTDQVAKICKVAPRTVNKWFDSGRLRGYRIPGTQDRRIPREHLIRFLKEHGMPLGELEESTETPSPPEPPTSNLVIWRVRQISCDGGQPGREWLSKFFTDETKAAALLSEWIFESNKRNPKYLFREEQEVVGGVRGYRNWKFGIMLTMDAVEVE